MSFILKNGGECVNFFFFISGFVMVVANVKYLNSKDFDFSKIGFYVKRIARIYPLYILALLLLVIFHYFIKNIDTQTVKYRLPFEILGIQRWLYYGSFNYPGWSISCEFLFYILFPFVYMKANKLRFKIFAVIYFVLTIIANVLISRYSNNHLSGPIVSRLIGTLQYHPILLFSVFLMGVVCGQVYCENSILFFQKKIINLLSIVLSLTAIFLIKYYLVADSIILKCGILSILYFVFVTSITSTTTSKNTIYNSFLFVLLGEISYAIYILQYPVYVFYTHYISEVSNGFQLTAFVFTLIGFALLTHYSFEIPIRNLILKSYNNKNSSLKAFS